ncbi:Inositol monophosphatase [Nitrosococcus oceani ATCC 19707]|uniref:Inositol monophosphatase n=2 Tax=Nitrosococcus oceani TaxID=1229 RepID=Q3JA40_NITOC|nr:inositol monophosphatase family protein [Nitrosococcus oceani]ABA58306.1 Inositol monophosphatase [Nitrosococcus oceani ATCC 19707]EDZ66787.1 Inositol monophosphatase family [Nitrosococcus oceani AFC27]KFI19236.1 inositol monophosphatase [Nitrosococcus oceani C-27]GEM18690.1 inositol phosphatase [Nitrosococcus oceani]
MLPDLKQLSEIVINTAQEQLLPRFAEIGSRQKADGSLLTDADLAMQNQIGNLLADRWPAFDFLSEEMDEKIQTRLLANTDKGVWCLDPLDGTRNFAAGIPCFGVSLALILKQEVVLGLVYDPLRGDCFSAQKDQGAWLNGNLLGRRRPSFSLQEGIGLVDFKRLPPALATRLATAPPYSSQRSLGSVALDWCWIAAGHGHVYLHGRQKLWDYAAGSLILSEAGGHALSLAGEPVFRATLEPRSVAAALEESLFNEWIAWLGIDSKMGAQ